MCIQQKITVFFAKKTRRGSSISINLHRRGSQMPKVLISAGQACVRSYPEGSIVGRSQLETEHGKGKLHFREIIAPKTIQAADGEHPDGAFPVLEDDNR